MEQNYGTSSAENQHWYVMTHLEPLLIDRYLQFENAERLKKGQASILYVIPYLYMTKANVERFQEDEANASRESLRAMKEADEYNSLRNSLHSFVFIKCTEEGIVELTSREWNRHGRLHLFHYRTKSGTPIKVSEEEMQPLLSFFIEQHQRFSFTPYTEEMSSCEMVYIKRGIFKNYKASVIEVHHLATGISLTLGIPMFGNEFMMELYDYSVSDVEVRGRLEHFFEPHFIKGLEADLFDILRRWVLHRHTDETYREDMSKLNTYSILHYLKFEDNATHNHFRALMLLCATLRKDRQAKASLIPVIMEMVSSTDKPATDEECFLLAVIFFATKKIDYRKAISEYGRTNVVTSDSLLAVLPLVKKMQVRAQRQKNKIEN